MTINLSNYKINKFVSVTFTINFIFTSDKQTWILVVKVKSLTLYPDYWYEHPDNMHTILAL